MNLRLKHAFLHSHNHFSHEQDRTHWYCRKKPH